MGIWAKVDADGSIAASSQVAYVHRLGVGSYEVKVIGPNLRNCAAVLTSNIGFTMWSAASIATDLLQITGKDPRTDALKDGGFSIMIAC